MVSLRSTQLAQGRSSALLLLRLLWRCFLFVFKEVLVILKVSEHFALPSTEARLLIRDEGRGVGWGVKE